NEELKTAHAMAMAASRAKDTFLAQMSHELRTPLIAIIGYSELIAEDLQYMTPGQLRDDVSKIGSAARHLLNLIRDTLDLSKIEAGRMEMVIARVSIAVLVEELVASIEPVCARAGNTLVVDADVGDLEIEADSLRLQQVLLNLLSNANKFTAQGTIWFRVRDERAEGRHQLRFEVVDTGIGIPEDKLALVFDAFTQAEDTTTRRFGGTGLGLTISRQLCEMMGGALEVSSVFGEGSTFTVVLPLVPARRRALAPGPAIPAARDGVVLAIGRDRVTQELARRLLSTRGVGLVAVGGVDDAVGLALALRPCAVLLEITTANREAWRAVTTLRSEPALVAVPLIVIADAPERHRALELGASEFAARPLDGARLDSVLSRHCAAPDLGAVLVVVRESPRQRALLRHLRRAGWDALTPSEESPIEDALRLVNRALPRAAILDESYTRAAGDHAELRRALERASVPLVIVREGALAGVIPLRTTAQRVTLIPRSRLGDPAIAERVAWIVHEAGS
ncbi:MAG: hypothetical protein KC468_06155, partial [Myxococcales bacterium]|nr:hypothetical protein [Myxococcales bacterium]